VAIVIGLAWSSRNDLHFASISRRPLYLLPRLLHESNSARPSSLPAGLVKHRHANVHPVLIAQVWVEHSKQGGEVFYSGRWKLLGIGVRDGGFMASAVVDHCGLRSRQQLPGRPSTDQLRKQHHTTRPAYPWLGTIMTKARPCSYIDPGRILDRVVRIRSREGTGLETEVMMLTVPCLNDKASVRAHIAARSQGARTRFRSVDIEHDVVLADDDPHLVIGILGPVCGDFFVRRPSTQSPSDGGALRTRHRGNRCETEVEPPMGAIFIRCELRNSDVRQCFILISGPDGSDPISLPSYISSTNKRLDGRMSAETGRNCGRRLLKNCAEGLDVDRACHQHEAVTSTSGRLPRNSAGAIAAAKSRFERTPNRELTEISHSAKEN
jgi:hypothetical protein